MRACRMGGLFALLARVGTSRHLYAGWKVCMLDCYVWFNRKLPSPMFRAPLRASEGTRRRAKPSRPYLFVASQQAGNLGRNLISPAG